MEWRVARRDNCPCSIGQPIRALFGIFPLPICWKSDVKTSPGTPPKQTDTASKHHVLVELPIPAHFQLSIRNFSKLNFSKVHIIFVQRHSAGRRSSLCTDPGSGHRLLKQPSTRACCGGCHGFRLHLTEHAVLLLLLLRSHHLLLLEHHHHLLLLLLL
jgi:hypothetical protein